MYIETFLFNMMFRERASNERLWAGALVNNSVCLPPKRGLVVTDKPDDQNLDKWLTSRLSPTLCDGLVTAPGWIES